MLCNVVCDDCNKYFGETIDLALSRDTLEGRMRFRYGVLSSKEFKSLGKRSRIEVKATEGIYEGMILQERHCDERNEIVVAPVRQIGVKKRDGSPRAWFRIDELPAFESLDESVYDLKSPQAFAMFGMNDDEIAEFIESGAWPFKKTGDIEPDPGRERMTCLIRGIVDADIQRGLAKIAFNYLAHSQGSERALDHAFDSIRRFIRYGETSSDLMMRIEDDPVLVHDIGRDERMYGHVLIVGNAVAPGSILATVSLFNDSAFKVNLAKQYEGSRPFRPTGVFYNLADMTLVDLKPWPRGVLPMSESPRGILSFAWARR